MEDFFISYIQDFILDLREINALLTEIKITNDELSKSDLLKIGSRSFDAASKYGKTAADYLSAVREAYNAGYENAADIAELSLAVQNAGSVTADLAGQYINATDKAYQLGGSVRELTGILDGANAISGHNAVDMAELAQAMSIAGSLAATLGIGADEATAALGTVIATAGQSGSEAADSLLSILLLIRQIADEGQGVDGAGLARYENACRALNVSLKETRNGITSLRDPMEVLRDLSEAYSGLAPDDTRRADLLASVGSTQGADALDAVLQNYGTYEKMLQDYANGTGSLAADAELAASSWEGSLNRLSNTWADTVGNIADSGAITAAIDSLNGVLSVVNRLTEFFGSLGTVGLGAGLLASFKNVGRDKMWSPN